MNDQDLPSFYSVVSPLFVGAAWPTDQWFAPVTYYPWPLTVEHHPERVLALAHPRLSGEGLIQLALPTQGVRQVYGEARGTQELYAVNHTFWWKRNTRMVIVTRVQFSTFVRTDSDDTTSALEEETSSWFAERYYFASRGKRQGQWQPWYIEPAHLSPLLPAFQAELVLRSGQKEHVS